MRKSLFNKVKIRSLIIMDAELVVNLLYTYKS